MKRIFAALSIVAVLAACNGKQQSNTTAIVLDTTAMKQRAIAEEQAKTKAQKEEADRVAQLRASTGSAAKHSSTSRQSSRDYSYSQPVGSSANPVTSGSSNTVTQPAKQGMSARTKGALIGGGAGAIAGGIIGHNVKGAIIGGVVGAGTGYVIGRSKDKKTGRLPNN
jgi:hypothetical protein